MAPSRSRNIGGGFRAAVTPARLSDTSRQPTITVDSGTPTKKSLPKDQGGPQPTSSPRRYTRSREQTAGPSDAASRASDSPVFSAGPRPSIDDDNVEGDQDLTSPTGDVDLMHLSGSDDSDSDGEELDVTNEDEIPNGPVGLHANSLSANPLHRSLSTPQLIPAPPNAFAPPFYNRPPTPLPPSPSLTSLLRPSFSSRPTTPDDSESEVAANGTAGEGSATEAVVAKSARDARTVPRASPKVPTYEYYGFILYLTSGLFFLTYLLWSYLPSPFLHQLGIYYYPNRWWSLAVPAFLVMLLVYIYVALAAYNTEYLTPRLGSVMNVVDEAANVAAVRPRVVNGTSTRGSRSGKRAKGTRSSGTVSLEGDSVGRFGMSRDFPAEWGKVWNASTDAVMDVPIGGVCEVLYGGG